MKRDLLLTLYSMTFFVSSIKFVNKQKGITKTMCDSVNHTSFPKKDHLPDCASRDKKVKKGDRVDIYLSRPVPTMKRRGVLQRTI